MLLDFFSSINKYLNVVLKGEVDSILFDYFLKFINREFIEYAIAFKYLILKRKSVIVLETCFPLADDGGKLSLCHYLASQLASRRLERGYDYQSARKRTLVVVETRCKMKEKAGADTRFISSGYEVI